jgi:hypothetical protein
MYEAQLTGLPDYLKRNMIRMIEESNTNGNQTFCRFTSMGHN